LQEEERRLAEELNKRRADLGPLFTRINKISVVCPHDVPHSCIQLPYMCVLILLYMCPHTAAYTCAHTAT
jgi:hypothetical protein